jgi:excinuclease ABC subunit C
VDAKAEYLGPFVDANAVRNSLKYLRKVFPYCTCNLSADNVCLYYHLGLCKGHGEKYITPKEYQANIRGLISFFSGRKENIVKDLNKSMLAYSKNKEFEKAAEIRNRMQALDRIRFEHVMEEKRELRLDKALVGLEEALRLETLPKRIECYDISNIFGRAAVGSMVVFENGIPQKNDYRRFEIKTVKRIDDFAMHKEVARRRFKNLLQEKDASFAKIPDLVIIDGGKGQLSSVISVVRDLKLPTKFVGITKKYEEIIMINNMGKFETITLVPNSEEFFLVQRIRDEAHRFAITYHRNLRSKELTASTLDNIVGIGPATKKKLIKRFGTIDAIKAAKPSELKEIVSDKVIENIKENL